MSEQKKTVGEMIGSPHWIEAVAHQMVKAFEHGLGGTAPRWTENGTMAMSNERWDALKGELEAVLEKNVGIAIGAVLARRGPLVISMEDRAEATRAALGWFRGCRRADLSAEDHVRGALTSYQMYLDGASCIPEQRIDPEATRPVVTAPVENMNTPTGGLYGALSDLLDACCTDFGSAEGEDDSCPVALGTTGDSAVTFGHMRRAQAALDRFRQSAGPSCGQIDPRTDTVVTATLADPPGRALDVLKLRVSRLEAHAWGEEAPEYLQVWTDRIQSAESGYPLTCPTSSPAEHPDLPGLRAALEAARSFSAITGLDSEGQVRLDLGDLTRKWAEGSVHTRAQITYVISEMISKLERE